jgi:hypothetical protein
VSLARRAEGRGVAAAAGEREPPPNGNGNGTRPARPRKKGVQRREVYRGERVFYPDVVCPWGWCNGDPRAHEALCLRSKGTFGVSWYHTVPRPVLWQWGHADRWERDADGYAKVTRRAAFVPPSRRWLERGLDGLTPEERKLVQEWDGDDDE